MAAAIEAADNWIASNKQHLVAWNLRPAPALVDGDNAAEDSSALPLLTMDALTAACEEAARLVADIEEAKYVRLLALLESRQSIFL